MRQPGGRGQPERGALRCVACGSARFRRRRHRQPPLRLGPRGSRRRVPCRRRRGWRSLRCGGCRVDDPRAARDAEAGCTVRARRPRASRHDARLAVRQPALRGAVLARVDGGDGRERRRSLGRFSRGSGRVRGAVAGALGSGAGGRPVRRRARAGRGAHGRRAPAARNDRREAERACSRRFAPAGR